MKSAVLNYLNTSRMKGISVNVPDVAASFQQAVVDVLVSHAGDAIDQYGLQKFALAGGVAANTALRAGMKEMCDAKGAAFYCPPPILCTDNAAMIGSAAYFEYIKGNFSGLDLNAVPGLRLGQR
jgi:N6-L-threonylcarbamoyladenine synthase